KRARANTGDGSASGKRSVTIMSRRNGSVADNAGSVIAKFARSLRLPNKLPDPSATFPNMRREAHVAAPAKKTAHPPMRRRDEGKTVSSGGTRKIHSPIATSVSNKTTRTDKRVPVTKATRMASRSRHSTRGQIRNETPGKLKI